MRPRFGTIQENTAICTDQQGIPKCGYGQTTLKRYAKRFKILRWIWQSSFENDDDKLCHQKGRIRIENLAQVAFYYGGTIVNAYNMNPTFFLACEAPFTVSL